MAERDPVGGLLEAYACGRVALALAVAAGDGRLARAWDVCPHPSWLLALLAIADTTGFLAARAAIWDHLHGLPCMLAARALPAYADLAAVFAAGCGDDASAGRVAADALIDAASRREGVDETRDPGVWLAYELAHACPRTRATFPAAVADACVDKGLRELIGTASAAAIVRRAAPCPALAAVVAAIEVAR